MELATAPFILRSLLKDAEVIETHVTDPATTLVTNVLGARFMNRYDQAILVVCKTAYSFFTLLAGQTLGEELCDLLAVSRGSPWQPIGIIRKMAFSILYGIEKPALTWIARKCCPGRPAEDIVRTVDRVVLCLLMLFEAYGTLSHRLLFIRYLSLRHPSALRQGSGARYTYLVPGLITALTLFIQLYRWYKQRRANASSKKMVTQRGSGSTAESSESDEEGEGNTGQNLCIVCFSKVKHPTCTPCGHVFCWSCITECGMKDARCPVCRQSVTLPSLVPLFFYKPKAPQPLGGE